MHRTRIYPAKNNHWELGRPCDLYWDFWVYESRGLMLRSYKLLHRHQKFKPTDLLFDGIVCPRRIERIDKNGKGTISPYLGFVMMHRHGLQCEPVVHEAVHMGMEFLRRKKRSLRFDSECNNKEEFLAYAIGCCATQINDFLYEQKLVGHA